MTVEMVQAIAGLWKLLLGLCFLVGMILLSTVYRSQSRSFLARLAKFKFKRGQTELSVNHEAEAEGDEKNRESRQQVAAAPPRTEASPQTGKAEEKETNWEIEMYVKFYEEELGAKADGQGGLFTIEAKKGGIKYAVVVSASGGVTSISILGEKL